jgi:KRAB domain-containing zinc finger protein
VKPYNCTTCGKSFSQKGHLREHIVTVHEGKKRFKCSSCDVSFKQRHSLKKHICIDKIQENSNQVFNCTFCDTSFKNDMNLKSHQCDKNHEGKKLYDCNFCDATFIDSDTLTKVRSMSFYSDFILILS